MRTRWWTGGMGLVAALALVLSACGSSSKSTTTGGGGGKTVNVYSSLPLQGASSPQTTAMVNGIRLALEEAGGKAGPYTVNYISLDDSTAQAGKWDPGQTSNNARKAAQDPNAVAYIGEFNSGASAISIPILNQSGLAQISPANTAVGLTKKEPGSTPGEPQKYYPTGKRTYMRIVGRDSIQAPALLQQMQADGCKTLAGANDKEVYGAGLATLLKLDAPKYGINLVSDDGIDPTAANYRSLAAKIKSEGAQCFVFTGVTANGAVQLFKDVNAALPNAKLYGPDGICESGFTNPAKKGIPTSVGTQFKCTVATLDLKSVPGGEKFLAAYKTKYGDASPDPYAIYGYEAMKLVLDTLARLGDKANDKAAVLQALRSTKDRQSVLGTYSFDTDGDTTLTDYGVYVVGPTGNPTFKRKITAKQ